MRKRAMEPNRLGATLHLNEEFVTPKEDSKSKLFPIQKNLSEKSWKFNLVRPPVVLATAHKAKRQGHRKAG